MIQESDGNMPYRVICADDDPITRKMCEFLFTRKGFIVDVVDNGDDAISRFVETPSDIVILDVEMRGMNGIDVCRILRGLNAGRHVPIVIMSGSTCDAEIESAERAGVSAFMSKPLQPDKLIEKCFYLIQTHELLKRLISECDEEAEVVRQLLCPGMDRHDAPDLNVERKRAE